MLKEDKNILRLLISKYKNLEKIIGSESKLEIYKICISKERNKVSAFCLTNASKELLNEHVKFFEDLGKENYFDLLKKNIENDNFLFEWICYENDIEILGAKQNARLNIEL